MAIPISVTISQRGATYQLGTGVVDVELAEAPALIAVSTPLEAHLLLDDERIDCIWRPKESVALGQVDLTNQVGFHRIKVLVGGQAVTYDFITSTTKANWAEIQKMAEVCSRHYLGYRKQFTYVARSGQVRKVLLPQIQFAWFRERVPELDRLVSEIGRRPATELRPTLATSVRAKRVSVPATIKLLHERPDLLEPREDGPVQIDGGAYWPSLVRVKASDRLPAAEEHAQIALFLKALIWGIDDLIPEVDPGCSTDLSVWRRRLAGLREIAVLKPYRLLTGSAEKRARIPTPVQQTDKRYGRLRYLCAEYFADIGSTDVRRDSIRANLKDISEIYQTFVAHVIGNALGLNYFSNNRDLRRRDSDGASMVVGSMRLYFDQKPPKQYLGSWREESLRPANERPDLLVLNVVASDALLLDAKFRYDRGGLRPKSEDLFEMHGYLNSFDIRSGGIVFPGEKATATVIEGRGQKVGEISLRASFFDVLGGVDALHEYVRVSLMPLWAKFSPPNTCT